MFLCSQETVLLHAHNLCQMAKRVQHYNRALIRHLIDDEAGAPDIRSDIEDSTDKDEEVSSCIKDELVDSEDESCSPNGTTVVTTEATVVEDVSPVTPNHLTFQDMPSILCRHGHLLLQKLVLTSHLPLWMPFSILLFHFVIAVAFQPK